MKLNTNYVFGKFKKSLLICLYKLALDYCYVNFIFSRYSYEGFTYEYSFYKYIASFLILILLFFFIPIDELKPSSIAINIVFLFNIVPYITYFSLADFPINYLLLLFSGFITIIITVKTIPVINLKYILIKQGHLNSATFICIFTTVVFLLAYHGLPKINAFNFDNVYDIRATNLAKGNRAIEYLYSWTLYTIVPFLIVIFLEKKQYKEFSYTILLLMLAFAVIASKAIFFLPMFILFLFFTIRKGRLFKFLIIFVILLVISEAIFYRESDYTYISFMLNRIFFDPILGSLRYYDFFSQNSFVYLSDSIFKYFINDPYNTPIPLLIGYSKYSTYSWNNVNFYMDDAFMHFGGAGIIIFSIILGYFMVLMNSIHWKYPSNAVLVFAAVTIFRITSGPMFTALASRGGLLAILIMWIYVSSESVKEKQVVYQAELHDSLSSS